MKDCNSCGKCCLKYGDGALSASASDIEAWELFNPEIFTYVREAEIWFNPETGQRLNACPWLRLVETPQTVKNLPTSIRDKSQETKAEQAKKRYTCAIYLDRPEDCRFYPSTVSEMLRDECEMIEVRDLDNPRRAQRDLDKLMQDSRPPYLTLDGTGDVRWET